MICETFDIKNENSQEYVREEAIGLLRNGREKCLHCNLWQQDFMQLSCGIL